MNDHLLLVSLGPVQDFIASARRCQDLWFGSWLLSELARASADKMRSVAGAEGIIFPSSAGDDDTRKPAVANKILVRVPAGVSCRDTAEAGRAAMRHALEVVRDAAFKRLDGEAYFERAVAVEQLDELMEYVWVSAPMTDGYAAARASVEKSLAARKNTRGWGQPRRPTGATGEGVPKSSLDGLRESVVREAAYQKYGPDKLRQTFGVKRAERLCGVGLLKRLGVEDPSVGNQRRPIFHSTSHVASAPLRARLARCPAAAQLALEQYVGALELKGVPAKKRFGVKAQQAAATAFAWLDGASSSFTTPSTLQVAGESLDGYLLYPSRIDDLLDEAGAPTDAGREAAREGLTAMLRGVLRAADVPEPPAYYAVLQADGDGMGAALDDIAAQGIDAHRELGAALNAFAAGCSDIVIAHAGSLIYAGGDDVLALLPLHTALACARELHDAFAREVAKVGALRGRTVPTLSVGIGVSHHLDDMADARALAVRAEQRAKAHPGKDALAILVSKRSGGELSCVDGWSSKPDERIDRWAKLLAADVVPHKASFDLQDAMAPLLVVEPGREPEDLSQVAASLAQRVVARKSLHGTAEIEATAAREEIRKRFVGGDVAAAVDAFAHELQIANEFLGAYEMAFGKVPS